jgi:hypothetical protein
MRHWLVLGALLLPSPSRGGAQLELPILEAPVSAPPLELHLDEVTLGWLRGHPPHTELGLRCSARWKNTGEALLGASGFAGGLFDGLSLVAVNHDGEEVVRQGFTHHQSPFSEGRAFELPHGETQDWLVFPIRGVPPAEIARVRLEGRLAGSDPVHTRVQSEWRTVLVLH